MMALRGTISIMIKNGIDSIHWLDGVIKLKAPAVSPQLHQIYRNRNDSFSFVSHKPNWVWT